jgi:hypothetical protein
MPRDIRFAIRNPDEPEAHERIARGGAAAQPLESQNPKRTGAPAGARAVDASSHRARGHDLAAAMRWQEAPVARAPAGAPGILGRGPVVPLPLHHRLPARLPPGGPAHLVAGRRSPLDPRRDSGVRISVLGHQWPRGEPREGESWVFSVYRINKGNNVAHAAFPAP